MTRYDSDPTKVNPTTTEALSIRRTHRYVGTYQHEDEWEQIGSLEVLGSKTRSDEPGEGDPCDPQITTVHAVITCDMPETDENIERAIRDTYTQHDCHHEYDCCGCRSYHVDTVERRTGDLWRFTVSSSRNY